MRRVIGCVLIMMATKAFAASGDSPRFSALPIPSDPKSVWLLDTYTGALSRCESNGRQPQANRQGTATIRRRRSSFLRMRQLGSRMLRTKIQSESHATMKRLERE
jgi:hypothetical protein